ncbi:retrograde regulation protein 2 [Capronia coronata CBS 617.96]|uniref:Retrograde regulation protein 2 n=1 Tax=Capronia coronata CBS 617.96 TaxID=1182541 RepID=W9ZA52_9EURO|nr:retrograde regulation protein 2 [Capronia coronata CBS 617.96]EXJ91379.1 retrograde regulation protein 2 [Capronia coronata CBS 617.96]
MAILGTRAAPTAVNHDLSEQPEPVIADDVEKEGTTVQKESAGGNVRIDPAVEKRVVRKIDLHVTPLVTFLFLLSFLDRSNIGNARIAGMDKDLDLVGDRYDWLLTIFYISYIVFQFQAFMWKILKPHTWACLITLAWGIIATCQAATQSWGGEMALRFLLGAAEAGFGPSIPYLLSFFYLRHEHGFRSGIFLAAAPLANTFAGALAYGITSGHSTLANWRLLYLVEGIPTICAAPLAWFFLPDSPTSARFLTGEEKEVARARVLRQHGPQPEGGEKVSFKEIGLTLLDPKAWFTALMYFSCNVSYSSLPVFLPTILNEMGFSAVSAQGLSAPPYFVSTILTVATCWIADRTQQRGWMIAFLSCIGGIGYILLATCTAVAPRYFGTFLCAAGVFPAIANILPWVVNNQGSDSRRGMGIVLLNLVGQCGPLLGTRIFPKGQAPRYVEGQSICAAFMFFNALLALTLRTLLVWENHKLDEKYGRVYGGQGQQAEDGDGDGQVDTNVGEENYGAAFRYIL